jgi:hypothetical protein
MRIDLYLTRWVFRHYHVISIKRKTVTNAIPFPQPAGFSDITPTSARINWKLKDETDSIEYLCENKINGENSGWIKETSWVFNNLLPKTVYSFWLKARNYRKEETPWIDLGSVSTE